MSPTIIAIITGLSAAIPVGLIFGSFLNKRQQAKRHEETEEKTRLILKEAEIAAEKWRAKLNLNTLARCFTVIR